MAMEIVEQAFGKLPVNLGDYDELVAQGRTSFGITNRVFRYGCELESLTDNNTFEPITWDGAETFVIDTAHWKLVSGNPKVWAAGNPKPASTGTTGDYPYNGMGRVVLEKNMQNIAGAGEPENIVCLLTQDMFYKGEVGSRVPNTNTIFVIRYDYVLDSDIEVPANCILQFEGGSVSANGSADTITGNNTQIKAGLNKIFSTDVTFAGTWNILASYPEWFDVSDAAKTQKAIQKAVNLSDHVVLSGDYNVQNSVYDPNGDMYTQRQNLTSEDYITVGGGKTIEITGKVKATSPLTDLFRIVGDNTVFRGGGIIEGCGVVNDYNDGTGIDTWKQWEASLIRIVGDNNKVEGLTIVNPTTNGIYVYGASSLNNIISHNVIGGGAVSHGSGTKLFGVFTEGENTLIIGNVFKEIGGKKLYSAVYSTGLYSVSGTSLIMDGNHIDGMHEHAAYIYSMNSIIKNNYITHCNSNFIQIMSDVSLVENNRLEVADDQIDDSNLANYTGVYAQNAGHTIRNNTFVNFTDHAVYISDQTRDSDLGIADNVIEGNKIDFHYGYLNARPICIYSTKRHIKNIRIDKNTIIGNNLSTSPVSAGVIVIFINNNQYTCKDVSICGNILKNHERQAVLLDMASVIADPVYYNILIKDNILVDCGRSSISVSQEADIQAYCATDISITGNDVSYTQEGSTISGTEVPFCKMLYLYNCSDYNASENTGSHYIKTGEGRAYKWFVLANCQNGYVLNNNFDGLQKGVFTISSGSASSDVTNIGLNYDSDYNIAIMPVNTAAIELQNSANYIIPRIYEDNSAGSNYVRMVRFETNTGVDVAADCKFAYEIIY